MNNQNEVQEVNLKKQKPVKIFKVDKLPPLFKKVYTQKDFNKKIRGKLYIQKDKDYVESLFITTDTGSIQIKSDLEFTKKELNRLKQLAKQIKSQKGRVKFVPLIVVIAIITAIILLFMTFKNIMAKKAIQAGLEAAFQARCDISSVYVGVLDPKLIINQLEVANKNEPMKNLFQVEKFAVDFDLLELLKGKFVMDTAQVTGIQLGTERKYSGALPPKKVKEKAAKPESALSKEIKSFSSQAVKRANVGLDQVFAQYNPQNIINNFSAQMKSPAIVADLQPKLTEIVTSWQTDSASMQKQIDSFGLTAKELSAINVQTMTVAEIKPAIDTLTKAVNEAQALQKSVNSMVVKVQADSKTVKTISSDVEKATKADLALITAEVNKITSFSMADGKNILSGAFDTILMNVLDKYYPLFEQGMAELEKMQKNSTSKKQVKDKTGGRSKGRTVLYYNDTVPSLLVRLVNLSGLAQAGGGSIKIDGTVKNISNNADLLGLPITADVAVLRGAISEKINAVVDFRTKRTGKTAQLDFTGNGYSLDLAIPKTESYAGVPKFGGTAQLKGSVGYDLDKSFALTANMNLNPARITSDHFEPAFAYNLYSRALAGIPSIMLEVAANYTTAAGLTFNLYTDADKQLNNTLTKLFNEELQIIKKQIKDSAELEIKKLSVELNKQISEFTGVQTDVLDLQKSMNAYTAQIEKKKKEAEDKLKAQVSGAVQEQKKQATDAVQDQTKQLLNKFF